MSAAPPAAGRPVASLAHELRSPLNGIKTWAHVLEKHLAAGDASARRAIAGIMTGVDQQVRLIEDLEAGQAAGDQAGEGSQRLRRALTDLAADAARLTAAGGTIGIDLSPDGATATLAVRGEGEAFEVSLPLKRRGGPA